MTSATLTLPLSVQDRLEKHLSGFTLRDLQEASRRLTEAYRSDQNSKDLFEDPALRAAYLAVRLPATYGCLRTVLSSLSQDHASLLDLGAGPATAYGALLSLGHSFTKEKAIFYEQSAPLFQEGASLWAASGGETSPGLLKTEALSEASVLPEADLVMMSFFLGELSSSLSDAILQKVWKACQNTLVILEPGTPGRFERLRHYRETLIGWGGFMRAPCPHNLACPIVGADWCHFSAKVDRSSSHRLIKGVSHPFELEKYSYLIVSKHPLQQDSKARLVRAPLKKPGHVVMDLCTPQGLIQKTVSKKDKEAYRVAKKSSWGDEVNFSQS